jgi:integrase
MQGRPPGLVFTFDGRPWDPDTATKEWAKLLKGAGLPSNVVLHGARHTVVDILDAAGVPLEVQRDIVGHSAVSMTRDYRTRVDQKKLATAMESMSRMLEQPKGIDA